MEEPLKITRETLLYIEDLWENNTDPLYVLVRRFIYEDSSLPKEIYNMLNHNNLDLYRVLLKDLTFEVLEEYVKEPQVGVVYLDTTTIPDDVLVSLNPFTRVLERFYIRSSNFYSKFSPSYDSVETLKLKEASLGQTELFEIAKSYHDKGREFGELKEMDIIETMDDLYYTPFHGYSPFYDVPHRCKHQIHLLNREDTLKWAQEVSDKIKLIASQGDIQKLITKPTSLHSIDKPR